MHPKKTRVLIIGASSGIGLALAKRLQQEYSLILGARRTNILAKEFPDLVPVEIDLCQESSIRNAYSIIEKNGGNPEIVIHSAGVGVFKSVLELTGDEFRQMIDTNLTGVFISCQEAFQRMKPMKHGTIVNIASLAGKIAFGGGGGYNASKFGLAGLSEALMLEAREFGIKVMTIFPGSVDTPFHDHSPLKSETKRSQMLSPEEVADFLYQLLQLPENFLCDQVLFRPLKKKGIK
ncbi:MAG: SDR family NAD(P)-dependent oxidoreductase [Planctomycetota bacterium]